MKYDLYLLAIQCLDYKENPFNSYVCLKHTTNKNLSLLKTFSYDSNELKL